MIYIFISILLFSLNNVLWKQNLENTPVSSLIAYRAFFTTILALLYILFFTDTGNVTHYEFAKITAGSISGVLGLFCMLTALKHISLQWIGIYNLVGVIFTALYLMIFENFDFEESAIGILTICIGFGFFIFTNTKNSMQIKGKQHMLLLCMTIFFTVVSLVHWKNLLSEVPPIVIIANQELIVLITGLFITLKTVSMPSIRNIVKTKFSQVLLMSLVVIGAFSASLLGLKITDPLVSGLLFLANPLVTILFSAYFFKEKVTLKNWIAIAIICLGAFLLQIKIF
ncbi:MAG: EamA family transporter [Flavobacteriales bacterium]